jgi:hypothetical protein
MGIPGVVRFLPLFPPLRRRRGYGNFGGKLATNKYAFLLREGRMIMWYVLKPAPLIVGSNIELPKLDRQESVNILETSPI